MAALEQRYAYAGASALTGRGGARALSLACSAGAETEKPQQYLAARALFPQKTARALRAVSEIAGARFYTPPAMLARILREADPVATVNAHAVRFEAFSACSSAYIRLDLEDEALDAGLRRNGTTNVDFGPELRGALASVGKDAALTIGIGADAVEIAQGGRGIVEKKVPLPVRWVRGFAEVQVVMAGMEPAFALRRAAAQRLLRALPKSGDPLQWVSETGGTARLAARESAGAVPLRGGRRLRVLDPLLPLAGELRVHVNRATGATAWVLDLGAQRIGIVLNLDPWQGFSGDGGLLSGLAAAKAPAVAAIRAQLAWQDRIEPRRLATLTGLPEAEVDHALAQLAAVGLLGFDLERGGYFHRVLPFDTDRILALNPRLGKARKLVAAGAVRLTNRGAEVTSAGVIHRVEPAEEGWRCTCPWFARHAGARGPCSHVLAMEIERDGEP